MFSPSDIFDSCNILASVYFGYNVNDVNVGTHLWTPATYTNKVLNDRLIRADLQKTRARRKGPESTDKETVAPKGAVT